MVKTPHRQQECDYWLIEEKRKVHVKIPKVGVFNLARSVGRASMKRPSVCLYVSPVGFGLSAAFPRVKLHSHCRTLQNLNPHPCSVIIAPLKNQQGQASRN